MPLCRLASTAGSAVLAFFNGALGTVLGTMVGYALLGRHLGSDGAKVAAALCARWAPQLWRHCLKSPAQRPC